MPVSGRSKQLDPNVQFCVTLYRRCSLAIHVCVSVNPSTSECSKANLPFMHCCTVLAVYIFSRRIIQNHFQVLQGRKHNRRAMQKPRPILFSLYHLTSNLGLGVVFLVNFFSVMFWWNKVCSLEIYNVAHFKHFTFVLSKMKSIDIPQHLEHIFMLTYIIIHTHTHTHRTEI